RMPVIAITGTNGKTTTTRMLSHIMQHAGRKPGMVCTDGIYVNGQEVEKGDYCSDTGHLKILTDRKAEIAVLETHHAGIMFRGFCFDWCEIAVCLNVTEDHLGVARVESVEQMAAVKQSLIERARNAAVLNADDQHCRAMLDAVAAEKICLVSMESSLVDLQKMAGTACYCILEQIDGAQWLVIHDDGQRLPVMPVAQIPATFDGTARFNTSNAMHAVVAAYLAGVEEDMIRTAMATFKNSYQGTPGRLNVFDDLPFRIVMDFAHNPDGMEKLCEFTDQQVVPGRKLVAFSGTVDRADETIRKMGRVVAGHFDFYFCKEYVYSQGKAPRTTAHLLHQGLLQAGVAAEKTAVMGSGRDVIFKIFDACKPGDLLVMLLGHVEKHQLPGYIEEYAGQLARSSNTGKYEIEGQPR
ncbi:MAG: Mur ligase family protein, partial [Xanthomonadales bacterium]|nr:Mur ligase family protein [Xanthomonadales bacterium]